MSDSEFGQTASNDDIIIGIGTNEPQSDLDPVTFDYGVVSETQNPTYTPDGVGTLDQLSDIDQVVIAEDSDDDLPAYKGSRDFDPTAANPASGNIGQLLTLTTNPDGSRSFT
ncbi:MAG: hypothetical protein EON58_13700, partial [Alphaproteobacteria bacterium]